jgi:hypothetical protein
MEQTPVQKAGYHIGQMFEVITLKNGVIGIGSIVELLMDDESNTLRFRIHHVVPINVPNKPRFIVGDTLWVELVDIKPAAPEILLKLLIGINQWN